MNVKILFRDKPSCPHCSTGLMHLQRAARETNVPISISYPAREYIPYEENPCNISLEEVRSKKEKEFVSDCAKLGVHAAPCVQVQFISEKGILEIDITDFPSIWAEKYKKDRQNFEKHLIEFIRFFKK